jgi:UDP-galactose transporter B1
MLLSVIVYNHKLTPGQWLGTAVVFAGISVEAFVKRKGQRVLRPPQATQTNAYKKQMYMPSV